MLVKRGGITFYEKEKPAKIVRDYSDHKQDIFDRYAWVVFVAGLIVVVVLQSMCVHHLGRAFCAN